MSIVRGMEDVDQSLHFENFPNDVLTVFLVKNVPNAGEIKTKIISGQLAPEAAVINAETVPDVFILHTAAYKVLEDQSRSTMKTRSIYSELIYNLSGSRHIQKSSLQTNTQIGEALNKFGVNDKCKHLIVARFNATPEDIQSLRNEIQGDAAPLDDLPTLVDTAVLKKFHKIVDEELKIGTLVEAIVSRIAARDVVI